MNPEVRNESEIFRDLESLCTSCGYSHAIAYFCFRDNMISYADGISIEDMLQSFSMERFVRTEISTLIGLMYKKEIDLSIPEPDVFQSYIDETESLLEEIHNSIAIPMMKSVTSKQSAVKGFNPFKDGAVLREPIFYSGESAYNFQYLELSIKKYSKDNDWFLRNKGYSIYEARDVVVAITKFQNNKINHVFKGLEDRDPREWSMLPAFILNVDEISNESGIDSVIIKSVIESFVPPAGLKNDEFSAVDDFNLTNAYPIIPLKDSSYLLFQNYSLVEALYETPFFWFNDDVSYKNIAMEHRGDFTEKFSAERLKLVFGNNRVFTNVDIVNSKKKKSKAGEIDVLVVFANRAIVVQTKSKKLTIPSRKGNDNCLQNDFKKGIQEAYDQGFLCANLLSDSDYKLYDSESNELKLPRSFKEIYIFCVISEHYPALSFQTRQFLKYQKTDTIMHPFVVDVFLLDAITEMLQTPLHFLSYINRRTEYADRIHTSHELTILSYHLKQNLWMDDGHTIMVLGDDISVDLDLAMMTRRDHIPGIATPKGILTKYKNTTVGKIIRDIERLEQARTIDLGFILLRLSGDAIEDISKGIEKIAKLASKDGKYHDLTAILEEGNTGLTIHCNNDPISLPRLKSHCEQRKYIQRANTWFGVSLSPQSLSIKFGLSLDYDWELSEQMEELVRNFPMPQGTINFGAKVRTGKKVGRNQPCPCGSGKKYKKCCIIQ
jgi:hypothetical protein